jgi:hypothetical protein
MLAQELAATTGILRDITQLSLEANLLSPFSRFRHKAPVSACAMVATGPNGALIAENRALADLGITASGSGETPKQAGYLQA